MLDAETCYRALRARDARFDGRFFTAVRTTGIYCRPICPARCPKAENCTFYATAAEAQQAGYRPCLRCRPEVAPDVPAWRGTSATVERAMALIESGALDNGSVDDLAARLGMGERQLRRLFVQHVGASPLAAAQARRVHLAKQLISETSLGLAEVALASGFGSVRRFNDCFQKLYGRPPSALRRGTHPATGGGAISLLLPFGGPLDWDAMLRFFAARALAGVERVDRETYARTIALGTAVGFLEVRPARDLKRGQALRASISLSNWAVLPKVVAGLTDLFDLRADPEAINRNFDGDPVLGPAAQNEPGLRVPGGWSGFEVGVRAILGQQVTLAAGRTLGCRLVERFGEALPGHLRPETGAGALHRLFPGAERLADADLGGLGMPAARTETIRSLARAAIADPALFARTRALDESVARLTAIPGIGAWTAQYIAMRALRHPDAFPAGDAALRNALAAVLGAPVSEAALRRTAERWRPWRAYAAQRLWTLPAPLAQSEREAA